MKSGESGAFERASGGVRAIETDDTSERVYDQPAPQETVRGALARRLRPIRKLGRTALETMYEAKMLREAPTWRKPQHLGIVMDGNRRFARETGAASVVEGHMAGASKFEEVLDWCEELDIDIVSVWIFSLDNFGRDAVEVDGLMNLFERKFLELVSSRKIHNNQIRICSIGRLDALPSHVQKAIIAAERATAHYTRRVLNVGVAYGGREEIVDATRAYLSALRDSGQDLDDAIEHLNMDAIGRHLYTAHVPDPDLILRTSGEVRLSGFLLWQSAQAEYYFCDTNWPAFRKIDFLRALRAFHQRQRRFGR